MRSSALPAALVAAALALSGCEQDPEAREGSAQVDPAQVMPVEPDGGIGDGAAPPASAPDGDADASAPIPAPIQGRWGLTEADCDPARSDNKGLLTITDNKLEFYESVGTLKTLESREPNRVRAAFSFVGEGMSWERGITLETQENGEVLIRREHGPDAAPGPFRYSKCA